MKQRANWGPEGGRFQDLSVAPKGREMTHYWTHSHAQIASRDAAIDYLASTGVTFRRESALNLYTSHQASTFGNIKKGPSLFDGISTYLSLTNIKRFICTIQVSFPPRKFLCITVNTLTVPQVNHF